MGLNDLGRKGRKVVIVTKKEGEAPLDVVDTHVSIHRDGKFGATEKPTTMEMPKPRPPSGDDRLVMRYTPPTALSLVSGTGVDTTNLASDK